MKNQHLGFDICAVILGICVIWIAESHENTCMSCNLFCIFLIHALELIVCATVWFWRIRKGQIHNITRNTWEDAGYGGDCIMDVCQSWETAHLFGNLFVWFPFSYFKFPTWFLYFEKLIGSCWDRHCWSRYSFESLSSVPSKPLYFSERYLDVKNVLVDTFFGPPKEGVYSPSVQRTLYEMAEAVLGRSLSLSLPQYTHTH